MYSRAMDMNGASVDEDDGMEPTIYKQKYERVMKELEYTKKRLQQQHEDDLEQLMALKKQLEKKVKLKSPYFIQKIRFGIMILQTPQTILILKTEAGE